MNVLDDLIRDGHHVEAWSKLAAEALACNDYAAAVALWKKLRQLDEVGGLPSSFVPLRIAILSGAGTEMLVEPLKLALTVAGFMPDLFVSGYDQFVTEMLDPNSRTVAFAPSVAIVVTTPFNVAVWPAPGANLAEAVEQAARACDFFLGPCQVMHERIGCEIVLNNLHALSARPSGNLGAKLPEDPHNFIRRVNVMLGDRAPSYVHINDVAAMAEREGLDRWFDLRYWYLGKQPVAAGSVMEYARNTASIVSALFGRTKKCLILDLDDTLWGGVVGDEGVEGIELGEGNATGEAFKAFQIYLRALQRRGVMLAVCSKNDERTAELPFLKHPEMVLTRDDFVSFKANWLPKSDNVRAIASELAIGLDACVFVDENPAEREEIRRALPEVAVPEMTGDPSDYPGILDAARYFEAVSLTSDDRRRTEAYRSREASTRLSTASATLSDYLASLNMKAVVQPFDEVSLDRITQLTNKTNQFNLTTRRLTSSQLRQIAVDPGFVTRSVRLRDRLGAHGLVSVFFAREADHVLTIEGWLMSCRMINRGVEHLLLNEIVAEARKRSITDIVGIYVPTERNGIVANLYPSLGFSAAGESEGATLWRLRVDEARPLPTVIEAEAPDVHARTDLV